MASGGMIYVYIKSHNDRFRHSTMIKVITKKKLRGYSVGISDDIDLLCTLLRWLQVA
jgi:hypothetical protein